MDISNALREKREPGGVLVIKVGTAFVSWDTESEEGGK